MNRADIHNGGFRCRSAFGDSIAATAGGAGDATEANGNWVSRDDATSGMAVSAKLIIAYAATLAEDETLSIDVNIQDASNSGGTGAADYGAAYEATDVATGGTGGTTEEGTIELDFDLSSANEFVRSQVTPDLSAAGTDTATLTATWVFFGAPQQPMSKSVI